MTNANPENQPAATGTDQDTESTTGAGGPTSGLPLRGLAMVLIAVAVLLAMWGLYATTQDNDPADTAAPVTTEAPDSAPAEGAGQGARDEEDTDDGDAVADGPTDEADGEDAEESTEEARPAPRGGAAAEPQRLHVLNNSLVPNLAADVAGTLGGEGYRVGEVGNLADLILPETTVFFQPGNADAETRARELADRLGGVAREYDPALPEGTDGRNDLTLVLVDQVAL